VMTVKTRVMNYACSNTLKIFHIQNILKTFSVTPATLLQRRKCCIGKVVLCNGYESVLSAALAGKTEINLKIYVPIYFVLLPFFSK
jgi:hypothetical protein